MAPVGVRFAGKTVIKEAGPIVLKVPMEEKAIPSEFWLNSEDGDSFPWANRSGSARMSRRLGYPVKFFGEVSWRSVDSKRKGENHPNRIEFPTYGQDSPQFSDEPSWKKF